MAVGGYRHTGKPENPDRYSEGFSALRIQTSYIPVLSVYVVTK